jgi:polyphosphate kinase
MSEIKVPTLSYLLLDPAKPFIHRDLSWIQFNERVLAEARSRDNPLLRRLKFLSISSSNLDEFFMIRFASLLRSLSATKEEEKRANLARVHGTVLESVRTFGIRQHRTLEVMRRECAEHKIYLHLRLPASHPQYARGRRLFEEKVLPHLVVKNDFKYPSVTELSNLQFLAYVRKDLFFEVPRAVPPLFFERDEGSVHVFFLDDLLLSHLDAMLPLKEKPGVIRITRDADFTVDLSDSDPESTPDLIRKNLGSRDRGRLVRLQYAGHFPKDFIQEAADSLKLDLRQCFKAPGTLCLHGILGIANELSDEYRKLPELTAPPLRSTLPIPFEPGHLENVFATLSATDFVLHHPYDSFDAYIAWLAQACADPAVTMIEQTIYRTDSVGQIVATLKTAAKTKKVKVVLELRARFDESNNLRVADDLRSAGCEVRFGFGALKLHAKVTLVTRKEGDKTVRYTHLATGNYNAKTARLYTDFSILTGNAEIGDDARHFFDAVFKNEVPTNFKQLVTAPTKMHQKIRTLIKAETEAAKAGKKARIFAKVNAMVDEKITEDLYTASQAGVQVDLVVRGACSLIPGVKGLSENIRVISIVDRLLEHSRIYYFQNTEVVYLSSADWMPRNFFSRLEIAFPVLNKRIYRFMEEVVIPAYLRDNQKARRLTNRGTWVRTPHAGTEHQAQVYFEELAANRYADTPLADIENKPAAKDAPEAGAPLAKPAAAAAPTEKKSGTAAKGQ